MSHIGRVLIIKLRAIGDVLLSTPVIQNLKDRYPEASIDILTESFAADVVRGNPWISNVISFDRREQSGVGLIWKIRKNHYDLIIDLFCNPRSALVTRCSGAPFRVGFPFRGRKYAYNILVRPRGGEVHNVEFNLDALRQIEIPILHTHPYFPVDNEAKEFGEGWIRDQHLSGKKLVGINASGGWYTKRWGPERFAQLADRIVKHYGATIILFWGPGELNDVQTIAEIMTSKPLLIPSTSLQQFGAIVQRCSYVISNDSGPMHIAAVLGIPTLGIFGPTRPELQGPYGERNLWIRNEKATCLGCNLTECAIGHICMTELSVETVFEAFNQLVEQNKVKAKN